MTVTSQPVLRRGMKRTGITLIVVGALLGIGCVLGLVKTFANDVVNTVNAKAFDTPVDQSIELDRGSYLIFQQWPKRGRNLRPSDATVTDPSGQEVALGLPSTQETFDFNGRTFEGMVQFEATTHGTYRVQVSGEVDATVLVNESITSIGLRLLGWIAGGLGAAMLLVAGIVVLIVRASKNRKSFALPYPLPYQLPYQAPGQLPQPPNWQQPAQQLPPPGWYPDPAGSAQQRWWDGSAWR